MRQVQSLRAYLVSALIYCMLASAECIMFLLAEQTGARLGRTSPAMPVL